MLQSQARPPHPSPPAQAGGALLSLQTAAVPSPALEFETSSQRGLVIIDGCLYQQGAPHLLQAVC